MNRLAAVLGLAVLALGGAVLVESRGGSTPQVQLEDVELDVGDSATIHVADPPATVRLGFAGHCASGGDVEMSRNPSFDPIDRRETGTSGDPAAHVVLDAGSWNYRLRCEGETVRGRIVVVADVAARALPPVTPVVKVLADGQTHVVSYPGAVPNIAIADTGAGTLHFVGRTDARFYAAQADGIIVDGKSLEDGTYSYWLGDAPDALRSTLTVAFDQTATQVRLERTDTEVRVTALAGWSATALRRGIDGAWIAGLPREGALTIRMQHPVHGVHYYVVRR